MREKIQTCMQHDKEMVLFCLLAIPVGAVIGGIDAVFGRILLAITDFRGEHALLLIPFLALGGALVAYFYQKYGKGAEKGMGLIFDVGHGEADSIPMRLIPFIMVGTWITHLFGGSAGREGVAVQIGAAFSHWVGKRIPLRNSPRIFLIAGMAAGFAGLFRTPLAATFFALEVLVAGRLAYEALLPAAAAAFTASTVSGLLGLEKFTFGLTAQIDSTLPLAGKLILLGIIFGIVGGAFAGILKRTKTFLAEKLQHPVLRIAVIGAALSVLLLVLYRGRYAGLGTNLIHACFYGEPILAGDWVLKFALTVITLAAGYQGGEVTPLFSIGASLGVVLGGLLGLPVELTAALGYAAVFGSASNTLLAPILIGAEVFGYAYLPCFFAVCTVAYLFNRNRSIYTRQKLSQEL